MRIRYKRAHPPTHPLIAESPKLPLPAQICTGRGRAHLPRSLQSTGVAVYTFFSYDLREPFLVCQNMSKCLSDLAKRWWRYNARSKGFGALSFLFWYANRASCNTSELRYAHSSILSGRASEIAANTASQRECCDMRVCPCRYDFQW